MANNINRRQLLSHGLCLAAGAGAAWSIKSKFEPTPFSPPAPYRHQALELIKTSTVVDLHSHPGRFFLEDAKTESWQMKLMSSGFADQRIADMRAANISASFFSIVADLPVIGVKGEGLGAMRDYTEGEVYTEFNRQLQQLKQLSKAANISWAKTSADIIAATQAQQSVAILSVEGGDFIEDQLDRIGTAYEQGVRSIGLVHYKINQFGDIQTEAEHHGGLTSLGKQAILEMNHQGIIVDLAHASFKTCQGAVEISNAPMIISHSNLRGELKAARLLSREHAKLISDNGGLIGAWPSGIGSTSLYDYSEQIMQLVDTVGIDHVAIGTDMDANYKPVLNQYMDFPELVAILLYRGMSPAECKKILGGNFIRLFRRVESLRSI